MSQTASPEILVHISAPCRARDDEQYRALVNAILGFEAASRIHYQRDSHGDSDNDNDTELASFRSDREVLSSQRGNDEAVEMRQRSLNDELLQTGLGHFAPEHGQDDLDEMRSRRPSPDVSPAVTAPTAPAGATSPSQQEQEQTRYEPDLYSPPVSVIPDSQPETRPEEMRRCVEDAMPGIRSPVKKRSHENSTAESHHLDRCSQKRPKITSSPSNGLDSRLPVPQGHGRDTPPSGRTSKLTQAQPPVHDLTARPPAHSSQQIFALNSPFPLLIQPPPPPISTAPFTTHITPTLDMLTRRLRPERIYQPVVQTRDLEPLERGYWCFDIDILKHGDRDKEKGSVPTAHVPTVDGHENDRPCPNDWDLPFFNTFWSFLSDFISEGRAGWGVWCILEERETKSPRAPKKGEEADLNCQSHSLSHLNLTLKVYTWGEIAAHVYLLLYLASERQVRCMGLEWKDAKGDVVVQMDG